MFVSNCSLPLFLGLFDGYPALDQMKLISYMEIIPLKSIPWWSLIRHADILPSLNSWQFSHLAIVYFSTLCFLRDLCTKSTIIYMWPEAMWFSTGWVALEVGRLFSQPGTPYFLRIRIANKISTLRICRQAPTIWACFLQPLCFQDALPCEVVWS